MNVPTLNYAILNGIQEKTDEFGIAVLKMQMDFVGELIAYALECHVQGVRAGKQPAGARFRKALLPVFILHSFKYENERHYELIKETQTKQGQPFLEVMIDQVMEWMIDQGELDYDSETETMMPLWDIETDDELTKTNEVDGVLYPIISTISPSQMLYFSENESLFRQMFPTGKFEMVQMTARHLREGIVEGSEFEMEGGKNFHYDVKQLVGRS